MKIAGRPIGAGQPVYIIAELSANHGRNLDQAIRTIEAMKAAGADAVKIQTYTADTLTIPCDNEYFRIDAGTQWDGRTLYELYEEASLPWDWQPRLQAVAKEHGLDFFSTPFDAGAVDFLEELAVPAYKVASFEMGDLPLLRKIASTCKPVIMSTGMATGDEIAESVATLRDAGSGPVALLKCTSAYPAPASSMNLRTIPDMTARFAAPVGLSDHTLGHVVPVTAVALGACIIEKHFTLSRSDLGPDSSFSLEPGEFQEMVLAVRTAESAFGEISYGASQADTKNRVFRRSLFVVHDIKPGEVITRENVRCIRPGHGLHPRHFDEVLGKRANRNLAIGTPLARTDLE